MEKKKRGRPPKTNNKANEPEGTRGAKGLFSKGNKMPGLGRKPKDLSVTDIKRIHVSLGKALSKVPQKQLDDLAKSNPLDIISVYKKLGESQEVEKEDKLEFLFFEVKDKEELALKNYMVKILNQFREWGIEPPEGAPFEINKGGE